MPLDKKAVEEFQTAYKQAFNEEIPYDEAALMARELLTFTRWLLSEPDEKLSTPEI